MTILAGVNTSAETLINNYHTNVSANFVPNRFGATVELFSKIFYHVVAFKFPMNQHINNWFLLLLEKRIVSSVSFE
jgi:hypothetical protein